jgi:hypothetical protein
MKDLRRRRFALQQSWGVEEKRRLPCDATIVADILGSQRMPPKDIPFKTEEIHESAGQRTSR